MSSWSINLFRVRGIKISLHWTFVALLYYSYKGWQSDGLPGLIWSTITVAALFACVVLHELGHSLTAMRFGVHVRQILLTPIGGIAQFDQIPRSPRQELLITAAGPAVNFVIAALLFFIVGFPGDLDVNPATETMADLGRLLLYINLRLGLFNLIPAFPMDGGRILRALLAMKLTYLRATRVAASLAKVLTVVGLAWQFYPGHQTNYFFVIICIFIFSAGDAEYRAVQRREAEEAQWKEALRQHLVNPPTDEPPVING